MAILDAAAVMAIALACGNGADPRLIDAIAQHESGRNPAAVSPPNHNGTVDRGLTQINSENFARFGLTPQSALDPCRSVDAASRHLIADGGDAVKQGAVARLLYAIGRYNPGDPTYTSKIIGLLRRQPPPADHPPPSGVTLADQYLAPRSTK